MTFNAESVHKLETTTMSIICCKRIDHDKQLKGKKTDLSQIIQRLLIDSIFFERGLAVLDDIVHDALIHATL